MKRTLLFSVVAIMLFSNVVFGEKPCDKIVFTEFGLSYGSVIDPDYISNSTTGVLDTAVFDAKAGVELFKWIDVYIGGAFNFYMVSSNWQSNYTFYPIFGGLRVNIMPEWCVYPSISAEYGFAFASHHLMTAPYTFDNKAWLAAYYNFSLGVNWKIEDIAVLCLSIERPAISNKYGAEIHIFKTGLAWKILY